MATLGSQPSSWTTWNWTGLNTQNQITGPHYTMPVAGWVTSLTFYAATYSGSCTFAGVIWNAGGGIIQNSGAVTLSAGSESAGGQSWVTVPMGCFLAAGTVVGIGWWRAASGNMEFSQGAGSSGAYTNTGGGPAGLTGSSTAYGGIGAYINYTQVSPASASSAAASSISATGAVLNGTFDDGGLGGAGGGSSSGYFLWGTSSTLSGASQTSTQSFSGTTTALSATLSGLAAGTTYYFQAVASNMAGSGSGSILSFTTTSALPPAPTPTGPPSGAYYDLAANGGTFAWTAIPGQVSYYLEFTLSGANQWWTGSAWSATSTAVASTAASATIPGANFTDGSAYTWAVAVANGSGEGPYCTAQTINAEAAPTVAVSAPTGSQTTPTPTIVWADTLPATAPTQTTYRAVVYSAAQYSVGGFTPGTSPSTWDSGAVAGGARSAVSGALRGSGGFGAYVQIFDGHQYSAWGSVFWTQVVESPPAPIVSATPSNATAAITVQITNPAPGGGETAVVYNDLFRFATKAGVGTAYRVATSLLPGAQWVDYAPASGVDYQYQAEAVDAYGNSTLSLWAD